MRKILTITSLLLFSSILSAQEITIGPEMGITVNDMSQKLNGIHRETYRQAGFRFGVATDFQFKDHFSLNTGLLLSVNNGSQTRGQINYYTGSGLPTSERDRRFYNYSYLQLPVIFMYKTKNEYDDPYFFFGVGPSFNLLVGGRYKQEYFHTLNGKDRLTYRNVPLSWSNNVGDDIRTDILRGFDIGANAVAGYQTSFGLYVKLQYTYGLLNIAPEGNQNNIMRNTSAGFSIGYFFKANKTNAWD